MVDRVATARLGYRALYVGLCLCLLFIGLLPLSTEPARFPAPDLILALTLAWVIRRPDYVPATAIVAVFLVQDLMTMRPPGVWTMLVLLGAEFLRSRVVLFRDLPLMLEWVMVAVVMGLLVLGQRLVFALFMVPQAGLGPSLVQLVVTVAAYPLVVAASYWLLGLRKLAPGEVDALGHRV